MNRRLFCLSLAVFALFAATTASAQDKPASAKTYRLRDTSDVGDRLAVDSTFELNIQLRGTANGQNVPPFDVFQREHEAYVESILAVDPSKTAVAIRRTYSLARSAESIFGGEVKTNRSALQGKTVTLTRKADKVTVAADKGNLEPDQADRFREDVESAPDRTLFPDREVAPGDEWPLDPRIFLRASLEGIDKAVVKAKFMDIVNYSGHPCARVEISLDSTFRLPDAPIEISIAARGEIYHALDLQRTLSVFMNGPVKAKGQDFRQGLTVYFTGDGSMESKDSYRWTQVAGKPVGVGGASATSTKRKGKKK